MDMNKIKKYILITIPVLYLIWSLQLNILGGPFFLSRSDPEYPYLLNGLNCSLLQFSNIGHTDHPGTPFQMLTGLVIRVTHVLIGQGPVVQDVLSRPEMYLACGSLFLTILTFFLLLWLGRIAMRNDGKLTGAIILQSTFVLSTILIELQLRYTPDRIMVMYNLILAGLTVKYLITENYAVRKYAILAGILMGVGFATKFNYMPALIIPLLVIPGFRNKLIYCITGLISFFISVLPILDKFSEFRRFISGIATHDGLYGSGAQRMINWKSFGQNTLELLTSNPTYAIILFITVGLVVFYLFGQKKFKQADRFFTPLKGFILAALIGFLLVSKHYKVVYFVPALSLSGLALFMIWMISGIQLKWGKLHSYLSIGLLTALIALSVIPMSEQYRSRIRQKRANMKTREFYAENVTKKDLMFIEPTWMAGPMIENALAYGISYVAHRHEFYQDYHQLYPNVITWEGEGQKPRLFRTVDADPESIIYSGKNIFVYSSPGRNAGLLLNYLDTLAVRCSTRISRDTVFTNSTNDAKVIMVRNLDRWQTLTDTKYLAEPTELNPGKSVTDPIFIKGVVEGDYLEITVRIFHNDKDARCRLIARSLQSDQDGIYFEDSGSLQDIGDGWQLLRMRGRTSKTPPDSQMVCQIYYPGNNNVIVEDLQIRQMGRR
jgi:hypothetical protein